MPLDPTGFESLNRSPERRREEAKQLIALLEDAYKMGRMSEKEEDFYECVSDQYGDYSEKQLAWLRDLVEKYT